MSRDDEYLASVLERALVALGSEETELRARVLARLAGGPLRDSTFAPGRRRALSTEALEIARHLDDPPTLAHALAGYISANHSPELTRDQVELATELVDVATAAGDLERTVEAHEHRAEALLELGDMQGAKADLEEMARVAAGLHQPSQDWFVAEIRAQHALLEGRLVEAEQLIADALSLGQRAESWSATVSFRLQMYMLRGHQRRLAEVEQDVRRSVDEYPTYPIWRCVLAHMTAKLGKSPNRGDVRGSRGGLVRRDPRQRDVGWEPGISRGGGGLAEHVPGAAALYRLLLPYADRVAVCTPEVSAGSVARYLGLLAVTLGRRDDAVPTSNRRSR